MVMSEIAKSGRYGSRNLEYGRIVGPRGWCKRKKGGAGAAVM